MKKFVLYALLGLLPLNVAASDSPKDSINEKADFNDVFNRFAQCLSKCKEIKIELPCSEELNRKLEEKSRNEFVKNILQKFILKNTNPETNITLDFSEIWTKIIDIVMEDKNWLERLITSISATEGPQITEVIQNFIAIEKTIVEVLFAENAQAISEMNNVHKFLCEYLKCLAETLDFEF